jgi:cyclophilin family peptidyl-prolyl cis-trans isomerase
MARSSHPILPEQFFIMTGESPILDGSYAAFGKVTGA